MKIVITGAGGLVGTHLTYRLAPQHQVLPLKRRDLDITDREALRRRMLRERPELIINCAVIGVDDCERDPALAERVNVAGPRFLAEAAGEIEAEFLHFSTNYVFDGEVCEGDAYTINDIPAPINVYGETKLAGEQAVRAALEQSFVVRTSWVYGVGKESFLGTAHRHLRAGERVRAIADVWASTTYVADLVARTEEILARRHYATYHIVNSGVCSYLEFAREAARVAGVASSEAQRLIEVAYEADAQRLARRPRRTPLRCVVSEELGLAPLRDWRTAVSEYITADRQPI